MKYNLRFSLYKNYIMIKEQDYLFKIVIVGNQGVGKSSLFLRFCDNNFIENYLTTIGVDFRFKMLDVDDKTCKLQIWDTAGQ
jgi:Ras-related protein Rab-1A